MNKTHVRFYDVLVEEARNVLQKDCQIVALSFGNRFANIAAHEERVRAEDLGVLWLAVGGLTFRVHVADGDVLQVLRLRMLNHAVDEYNWRGGRSLTKHGVSCKHRV